MYNLIGLAGLARSGKNTVGDYLAQQYGYTCIGFADKVKECALAINPYIDDRGTRLQDYVAIFGIEAAKQFPEVRRLFQAVGTELGRDIVSENIWVDLLDKSLDPDKKYVITDLRFANEAEYVRSRGGIVINIERPGVDKVNDHVSENGLCSEYYDIHLLNDSNLAQLHHKIDVLFKKL